MSGKNVLRIVLGVIVGGVLLMMVITKQVKFTETAIVETFGQPSKTLGAGLHFRWPIPIQEVITYDTRVQRFETPYEQLQTIKRALDRPYVQIVDIQYDAAVTLICQIPEDILAKLKNELIDSTHGRITISDQGSSVGPA